MDLKGHERDRISGGQAFGYIPAIDGLRAVAVLSVILYHLNAALLPGGFVGVDIFFVISGFVVTGSLMGLHFERVRDLLAYFYARRLVRIMPALIVMLTATIILTNMFVPRAWLSKAAASVAKTAFFGFSNITLAFDTDTYFAPEAAYNPFIHTWSLGVEEQFYLLFPFLFFWHAVGRARADRDRTAILAIVGLSILSLLTCAWMMQTEPRHAFYQIPARFWELGIGMILCLTAHSWIPKLASLRGWTAAIMPLISILLIAGSFAIHESGGFPFPLAIPPVLGAAGLIMSVCAWREGIASRTLALGPVVTIGKLSYSLYLWHWPVFVLFRWTVGLETIATATTALALVFLLGWLSYKFVEMPTRHNRSLSNMRRSTVVFCSLAIVALAAGAGTALLRVQQRMSLSQTRHSALWYADSRKPLWLPANCELDSRGVSFDRGQLMTWTPKNCRSVKTSGRIFVIGDSHGLAYNPLLRQYAADTGAKVQLWYAQGCGFMYMNRPFYTHGGCDGYYNGIFATLRREMKPGDVLFLPNLRVPRFADQNGQQHAGIGPIRGMSDDPAVRRRLSEDEAINLWNDIGRTGAHIVYEAPLPIFRVPPFRCSDWFNRYNPACAGGLTISRAEMEAIRASAVGSLNRIAANVDGVTIWDPLPWLCSEKQCDAARDGKPLFFDGDHISGYANEVLYPHFRDTMLALAASQRAAARNHPQTSSAGN